MGLSIRDANGEMCYSGDATDKGWASAEESCQETCGYELSMLWTAEKLGRMWRLGLVCPNRTLPTGWDFGRRQGDWTPDIGRVEVLCCLQRKWCNCPRVSGTIPTQPMTNWPSWQTPR